MKSMNGGFNAISPTRNDDLLGFIGISLGKMGNPKKTC